MRASYFNLIIERSDLFNKLTSLITYFIYSGNINDLDLGITFSGAM